MKGDIYRIGGDKRAVGHEQAGPRYGVVIQDLPLSTTLVAPTSRSARRASFRCEIDLDGTPTRVLLEQTRAMDIARLGDMVGRLDSTEMADLNYALRILLGLLGRE